MTERLTDEPAAWLCEDLAWEGETSVTTDKAHAERRAAYATAWRVTPLYTHRRATPADDLRAVREKIEALPGLVVDHPSDERGVEYLHRDSVLAALSQNGGAA